MTLKEIMVTLGEDEGTVRYWLSLLLKNELINPKRGNGNKWVFSEDDTKQFEKFKQLLCNGAKTTTEAIHLMKSNVTPVEALHQFQRAQRDIQVLQQKVVALRKPFWERVLEWFGAFISKVLPDRAQS